MNDYLIAIDSRFVSELDPDFIPASLYNRAFLREVNESGEGIDLAIAIERNGRQIFAYRTRVFNEGSSRFDSNYLFIERLIKSLLWAMGGFRIIIGGSRKIGEYIRKAYSEGGVRAFDANFMSRIYEHSFEVVISDFDKVPVSSEQAKPAGRNLDGCRIGFDAGGSDRKVSAVMNGDVIYSEEVVWHPKTMADPDYHFDGIVSAFKSAASHLPRVDAIGISSAGVYVDNRTMVASLFMKVPQDLFDLKVKDIYIRAAKEIGNVPVEVANDGDVTALAGAMDLDDVKVLGIAMGTSEAGGYVDGSGCITGRLNELCFVPVDYNPKSIVDEWSGDYGCGVKYFSQDAVSRLAAKAGIDLDPALSPSEKLKAVQKLHESGDGRVAGIYETIGIYLGYEIALYAEFYDIKHVLILGRVTSGKGGNIILNKALQVSESEFPDIYEKIRLILPDESNRRVGQSIAAASLPKL